MIYSLRLFLCLFKKRSFCNLCIFTTWCLKPLIFQFLWDLMFISLKYYRFTQSCWKDIGIVKLQIEVSVSFFLSILLPNRSCCGNQSTTMTFSGIVSNKVLSNLTKITKHDLLLIFIILCPRKWLIASNFNFLIYRNLVVWKFDILHAYIAI